MHDDLVCHSAGQSIRSLLVHPYQPQTSNTLPPCKGMARLALPYAIHRTRHVPCTHHTNKRGPFRSHFLRLRTRWVMAIKPWRDSAACSEVASGSE